MAREVAQAGILQEFQAAYKRLYYSDADFKKQVDDFRASKKQLTASTPTNQHGRAEARRLFQTCAPGMARYFVGESPMARQAEPKARKRARASP